MTPILISASRLKEALGISRSMVYRLMRSDPTFPKPRQITEGRVAWLPAELQAWAASRPVVGEKRGS